MNATPSVPDRRWWKVFAIDLRSLALFRIALGAIMLVQLWERSRDFRIFHTDEGVWPVAIAWAEDWRPGMWSLHLLHGGFGWQATLFALEGAAALALLLGWRTRVASILAWVLVASAHKGNVMVVSSAGSLLRQFLFWGMWLPLGARWSLEARRVPRAEPPPTAILSGAGAALLLQVVLVYWANVLFKSDPAWRVDGTAVFMALSQETYARPLGRALLEMPELLRALTFGTLWLELLGPALAFIPWRHDRWRLLAVALFVSFHAGLQATLYIGLFPLVSIAGWLPFVPGRVWERGPNPPRLAIGGRWPAAAALAGFAVVLAWNLRAVFPPLKALDPVAHLLRFEQRWALFAPKPRDHDAWWVVIGTDATGRETNLWTGESPVNWARPRDFAEWFPSDTWKLYLLNLRSGTGPRPRLFAEWLARRWRARHPDSPPFVQLEICHLEESIYRRGETPRNYSIYKAPFAP